MLCTEGLLHFSDNEMGSNMDPVYIIPPILLETLLASLSQGGELLLHFKVAI